MDEPTANKIILATHWPRLMAACALGMLAIFLLVLTIGELKSYRYIGSGITPTNTITVDGEGIAYAVPDTATFTVTVEDTAADVTTAQTKATTEGNAIIAYLKQQGVADTDVQTTDYEINPQYSYQNAACPAVPVDAGSDYSGTIQYCPPGKQTLTGYQVSQTLTVKVTDTSKAGTILSGVGSLGASSVSGLSFTVADEDAVDAQARDMAIMKAQSKAQDLAKALGVQLVSVVGFNENNNSPGPIEYAMNASAGGMAVPAAAPAPSIPTGQNKVVDDVTLTYEIQ